MRLRLPLLICLMLYSHGAGKAWGEPAAEIVFNRDIRPILSDNCFQCHGPDSAQRAAELRLDTEEGAKGPRDTRPAIVPGDVDGSELLHRIVSQDPAARMPPHDSGKELTDAQIALLRAWIAQGAEWQPHWSLIAPTDQPLPNVQLTTWPRQPLDHFVLARLEEAGLAPAPETDRVTLLRRVTFDLTGLPPSLEEVEAFLADDSEAAYERVVDRLLDSPRYGERMATRWLNAARYADTNGYQNDGDRTMWRWRDWVIDAYNQNMPFDQFTIEQLAGDLLPNATLDQRIASGFNRNHRGNSEGGIIPEEYAVEYVVDRVDTTATVWLGMTLACARCHDHKFDPITQREFYQFYAYFNQVPERGRALKYGNSPPMIAAPTKGQQSQHAALIEKLASARTLQQQLQTELDAALAAWASTAQLSADVDHTPTDDLLLYLPLDDPSPPIEPNKPAPVTDTSTAVVPPSASTAPDAKPREIAVPAGTPLTIADGVVDRAVMLDGSQMLDLGDVADFGFYDKFSLALWIKPQSADATILARKQDIPQAEGYSVELVDGLVHVNLVKRWLDDAIRVRANEAVTPDQWQHLLVTYDGSRVAAGVKIYLHGRLLQTTVLLDELYQSFETRATLQVGGGSGAETRFRGVLDDLRVYHRVLGGEEAEQLAVPERIADLLAVAAADRTTAQASKLRAYYLAHHAPAVFQDAWSATAQLEREHAALLESFPTSMVMEDMSPPRDTHILLRGVYDQPGEIVTAGLPACFPPRPADSPNNRLGLARWLVDPQHPLTSRVAVNRLWQMLFGVGLVSTVEDFGSQGAMPTHPAMLDHLASEYVRQGWDTKRMLKQLVTSATYRQSSRVSPELLQRDPDNRLLARGARVRLSAEMIRDQALFASGLLVEAVGGPSVRPYQPADLWKDLTENAVFVQDHGDKLYRRGMYTFWKRTVAPPSMMAFDASTRETCTVRESRTNTPLQALTLLNDVTYVEAARKLAERACQTSTDTTPTARIARAFQLLTSRHPKPAELAVLVKGFEHHHQVFRGQPAAALALLTAGESPWDQQFDPAELAAHATIASLLLNLDEVIHKE